MPYLAYRRGIRAVAPSVLSADFLRLGEEIAAVEAAGAEAIHIDIMDGHFVDNISMGPFVVRHIRRMTQLPLDVHLMISEPEKFLIPFVDAGSDGLTVHHELGFERMGPLLTEIRRHGCAAGIAFNPGSTVDMVLRYLPLADQVLMMTVVPGRSSQSLIESVLPVIGEVRRAIDASGHPVLLEVDGGINDRWAPEVRKLGAELLVSASYIFRSADYASAIGKLRA